MQKELIEQINKISNASDLMNQTLISLRTDLTNVTDDFVNFEQIESMQKDIGSIKDGLHMLKSSMTSELSDFRNQLEKLSCDVEELKETKCEPSDLNDDVDLPVPQSESVKETSKWDADKVKPYIIDDTKNGFERKQVEYFELSGIEHNPLNVTRMSRLCNKLKKECDNHDKDI